MRGHDAVAQALVDQGVDTVFGVLGDANLFIGECLMRVHDVTYIAATHEASAVLMAQGLTKATGQLGIATVTHGPALTNTMTALVEGVKSRTPMVLVAGDTPTADEHHLQNVDQRALVEATGAGFQPVLSPDRIAVDVATAVRRAHAERRPIVLNIPLEYEWADIDYVAAPVVKPVVRSIDADPAALDEALGIIASANRPLILAGRGAVHADAHDALVKLADVLGAPLATTILGTGYFKDDPCNIGIFGTLSSEIGGETIMNADCVISFGAALTKYTTSDGDLLAGKTLIQCDVDPLRLGATVPNDVGVVGDARRVAETMTEWLVAADHTPSSVRGDELAARIAGAGEAPFVDKSTDTHVDPRASIRRLHEILPDDRTVAIDAGRFMIQALTLPVPEPTALVGSHSFGSIGLGMGTAIGAAVGRPDRPTVLMVGDGGFMMGGLNELHTAVHEKLDLIVVLHNDGSYGAEHIQLVRKGMDPAASLHDWPDFVPVAEALGCDAVHIQRIEDFDQAAKLIEERTPGRPVFIEIAIDPDVASSIQH